MLYFLQSIDQFGAQQKLQIPTINPKQKSAFGGLVTLTLYGISLGYFLFQFVDWQQKHKLSKVTSPQKQINENQQLNIKGIFAEISYFKELKNQIDPFDPKNMILQPFFKSTTNSYSNANYPINQATNKHQMNKPFIRYFWKILQFKTNSQTQQIINILFMNYPLDIVIRLALGWIKMRKARFSWSIFLQDNYFQLLMYFEQFDPRKKQIIKVPLVFVFDTLIDFKSRRIDNGRWIFIPKFQQIHLSFCSDYLKYLT